MPWTASHIAAVVPLRRWCPAQLSFFGLAVGSMTPDLGYYLGLHGLASAAHTLAGFALNLPAGVLLAALAWSLRGLLVMPLPQPHREALRIAFVAASADFTRRRMLALGGSILLGAATHVAWDSFTHATGLPVRHSDVLRSDLLQAVGMAAPAYALLQHASTLFGIVVLAIVYRAWLRGLGPALATASRAGDAARWRLLGAFAMAGAGILAACISLGLRAGHPDVADLVVSGVLFTTDVLVVAWLAAALAFRRLESRGGGGGG